MSEAPHEPAGGAGPAAGQAADATAVEQPTPGRGARRATVRKWTKRIVIVIAAALASVLITFFSVDIGDISIGGASLRTIAEREGSKFLERPFHIGRISALVTPGKFAFENVVIEGPTKDDRPFFSARRITVDIPWWALFRRELFLEVNLYDWTMTVENWAEGGARMPKLRPKGGGGEGPRIRTRSLAVYAHNGQFVFDDHVSNWGVVAPNLNFALVRADNLDTYVGTAQFSNGTTRILDYLPMKTDFRTRFQLQGPRVRLHHIDLTTDGAESHVSGYVNFGNWPEQEYSVSSEIDFARMREIFFAQGNWGISGHGGFQGMFKFSKTGRELAGQFDSEEAGLTLGDTEWRFPNLHGALEWTSTRFVVTHAESDLLGGTMRLSYGLVGLGSGRPSTATFTADYQNVDLYRFTRQFGWTALEPQGRMQGTVAMGWPNGHFQQSMEGTGETVVTPMPGATVAADTLPADAPPIAPDDDFIKFRPYGPFALAADTKYRFTASSLDFDRGTAATPTTFVRFSGHARGGPVNVPFHVTSQDWQDSDRLFAAIMTNFASPMGAIEVGGRGTFDGTLTKAFNAPRIEGRFTGDRMRAWDVEWGTAEGTIAIENNYMDLVGGVIRHPSGGIVNTSGKFSLGYPRQDAGEEINADLRIEAFPLDPLKSAFQLGDWPVTGTVESATLHLQGQYEKPSDGGKPGTMRIVQGTAWDEPFEAVTSALGFEGNGSLLMRGMRMEKAGAIITGIAWVSWEENRYSFNAQTEGTGVPVDKLSSFKIERAPLSGQLTFTARGDSSFDEPRWTFNGQIADLYAGDEGVGAVNGRVSLEREVLQVEVAAESVNRLRVLGGGEISLDDNYTSTLHFRFTETSIDPYLKFFAREMSYTKAIASGTIGVSGPLGDLSKLAATATVERANLTLFAYALENDGEIKLEFKDNIFRLQQVKFKGTGTGLELSGSVDNNRRTADIHATGSANLAVLQAFYTDLSAEGTAALTATLSGGLDKLVLDGSADITEARLRHLALPHAFQNINGRIVMREGRIAVDELRATMGEGPVTFAGAIVLDGYRPVSYDLSAEGRSMHLRIMPGLRSTVDANMFLRGPIASPTLSGDVDVLTASYSPRLQTQTGYMNLLTGGDEDLPPPAPSLAPEAEPAFPMRLDIRVRSGVIPFIENNAGSVSGSADVEISGTISRTIVSGRVLLDRGEWVFSGNRYRLQGGLIEFTNPAAIDPFFDISLGTRVRTTGQYYDVNLRMSGTLTKLDFTIASEPWLPEFQVISLLLGESPAVGRAELLARSAPQELQAQALRTAGLALLTSPISATVGSVAERVTAIDTVQIVPVLGTGDLTQLSPTARITLGKRLSERFYLTYSRTLSNTSQNEIILIEFDQNDQISWILSRNEDRSFALDFRIKHVFR